MKEERYSVVQRCNPVPAPVGGFFVLNRCGGQVAGPIDTRHEAQLAADKWAAEDRAADVAALLPVNVIE